MESPARWNLTSGRRDKCRERRKTSTMQSSQVLSTEQFAISTGVHEARRGAIRSGQRVPGVEHEVTRERCGAKVQITGGPL